MAATMVPITSTPISLPIGEEPMMSISLPLALASILALTTNVPQASQSPPLSTAERIAQLETLWNDAHLHGDVDILDQLWASEVTVIVPEMPLFSKEDLLKMWRSMKVSFSEYSTTDVGIHVHGDIAIVTGRLHRSRDFGGRIATEDWLFTKTYAELDGQWKVLAYHASVVPKP